MIRESTPRDEPARGDDLEKLIRRYPPPPADQRTMDRLASRAMGRLRHRGRENRARRRGMIGVATLAGAAALLVLVLWPGSEDAPSDDAPTPVAPRIIRRPGAGDSSPTTVVNTTPAREKKDETRVAAVTKALETAVGLRASRREILRDLRQGGPDVLVALVEALKSGDHETALAAAQLLASIATSDADAAVRRALEEGLADGGDGLPAEAAEMLVAELLRRRDPAGRKLVRSLLETPSAGRLVVRQVDREQGLWAADLLGEASASPFLALSSEALGLLSHRRPRRAASAFLEAMDNLVARGEQRLGQAPAEPPGAAGPADELTEFLRQTLPRLSVGSLAHVEEELRRRARSAPTDWVETLAAALGRSGSTDAWPLLVAIVEVDGARPAVLRAFGALGDERAVPILERYVQLEDDRGEAAIRSLAEIPGASGVRALLRAYLDLGAAGGQLFPRTRALLAGSLRDRADRTLAELRRRLADLPDQRTLGALIELFPGAAGDELAGLLERADRRGRPQVFRALAQLATAEAVTILIDALEEPSLNELARQSLTRIAHRDLGPRPESWREWLRDYDPGTRRRVDLDRGPIDPWRRSKPPVLVLKRSLHLQEEA